MHWILALLLLTIPLTAIARDGVLEINQTCAVGAGCLPGDASGFPVTIAAPGSYVLTGSLDLTAEPISTDAIVVSASAVTLDLNGFAILGPSVCTGSGATRSCTQGAGSGVESTGGNDVTVQNGTITGMGASAIFLFSPSARIVNMTVSANGGSGFLLSQQAVVQQSASRGNGGHGVRVGGGSVIENVSTIDNRLNGVEVGTGGDGVVIRGVSARNNGGNGLHVEDGALLSDVTADDNGEDGIEVVGRVVVESCNVRSNGSSVPGSRGIDLTSGSGTFTGCSIALNTGHGIEFSDQLLSLSRSTVIGNSGDGVRVDGSGARAHLDGNSFRSNLNDGIAILGGAVASLSGNLVSVNFGAGIRIGSGSVATLDRNTSTGNSGAALDSAGFDELIGCNYFGTATSCPAGNAPTARLFTTTSEVDQVVSTINNGVYTTVGSVNVTEPAAGSVFVSGTVTFFLDGDFVAGGANGPYAKCFIAPTAGPDPAESTMIAEFWGDKLYYLTMSGHQVFSKPPGSYSYRVRCQAHNAVVNNQLQQGLVTKATLTAFFVP